MQEQENCAEEKRNPRTLLEDSVNEALWDDNSLFPTSTLVLNSYNNFCAIFLQDLI